MASFKAKFPVLQELFAKNHGEGALGPPSGARVNPRPDTVFRHLRPDRGGGGVRPLAFPNEAS